MKKKLLCLVLAAALLAGPAGLPAPAASWPGVDETVIEKFAEQGGRQAREPLINTDQGDLLLFVFLLAGIVGGFIGGYCFCVLFPPKRRQKDGPDVCPAPAASPGRPAAP
jgi:hypothetical protein